MVVIVVHVVTGVVGMEAVELLGHRKKVIVRGQSSQVGSIYRGSLGSIIVCTLTLSGVAGTTARTSPTRSIATRILACIFTFATVGFRWFVGFALDVNEKLRLVLSEEFMNELPVVRILDRLVEVILF